GRPDRSGATVTTSTRSAEESPLRGVTTGTAIATSTTSGDCITAVTTIATVAEPGEQAGGAAVTTVTASCPVPAVAAVAAEQTALATIATIGARRGIRVGRCVIAVAAIAPDPATCITLRVTRGAVVAVTERHQ